MEIVKGLIGSGLEVVKWVKMGSFWGALWAMTVDFRDGREFKRLYEGVL